MKSEDDFLGELCEELAERLKYVIRAWVCYGSYAIGMQSLGSDVDLLCIHGDSSRPAHRIQESFRGVPVTVYSLCIRHLADDGFMQKYGGYFSCKLLNPYKILQADEPSRNAIQSVSGAFIGRFAKAEGNLRRGERPSTSDEVAADCFLAFLRLCPEYLRYFARLYASAYFQVIWHDMARTVVQSLELAREITYEPKGIIYRNAEANDLHPRRVASIARFWSFGAWSHSDAAFYDHYVEHVMSRASTLPPGCVSRALHFLESTARGDENAG